MDGTVLLSLLILSPHINRKAVVYASVSLRVPELSGNGS